jgi:hypothetical protein
MIFGNLDDSESEVNGLVNKSGAKTFHPEYNTKPNVYYIGLDKMAGYFIAGNVAFKDTDECAENVKVTFENERIGEEKPLSPISSVNSNLTA